eukprot:NODE_231_length_13709_cov_0.444526.p4 type:complete len:497 gc:universal NODE_231_length_13709_cov_0.444526:11150-9660(-)
MAKYANQKLCFKYKEGHVLKIRMLIVFMFVIQSENIADCANVVNLARGLNISSSTLVSLTINCCNVTLGVECIGSVVTSIAWSSKSLNGVLNTTALPSSLTDLDLSTNKITGKIGDGTLPAGILNLDLHGNLFNGSLPTLPPLLENLIAQLNSFSGILPQLPDSLIILRLSQNQISGSLPKTLPVSLENLEMPQNMLTGHFNYQSYPIKLKVVYLQRNKLTGNLNNLANSNIEELKLQANSFYGDVPELPDTLEVLWLGYVNLPGNRFTGSVVLNVPSELRLNDNWITDLVIFNADKLTFCDISNNPLSNSANIETLKCTKSGLYSPLNLPNTRKVSTLSPSVSLKSSALSYSKTSTSQIFTIANSELNTIEHNLGTTYEFESEIYSQEIDTTEFSLPASKSLQNQISLVYGSHSNDSATISSYNSATISSENMPTLSFSNNSLKADTVIKVVIKLVLMLVAISGILILRPFKQVVKNWKNKDGQFEIFDDDNSKF